jgi:hypothetical protein
VFGLVAASARFCFPLRCLSNLDLSRMHRTADTVILCDFASLNEASLLSEFTCKLRIDSGDPLCVSLGLIRRNHTSTLRALYGLGLSRAAFASATGFSLFSQISSPLLVLKSPKRLGLKTLCMAQFSITIRKPLLASEIG